MITQGSKEHPVILNDHVFGPILKEVHWELGVDILEIVYPGDSDYDFLSGSAEANLTFTPAEGPNYSSGDKVTDTNGFDKTSGIIEIRLNDPNPIQGDQGGSWVRGLFYNTPFLFQAPTWSIVDDVQPNPFHDWDQSLADGWTAYWNKQFANSYASDTASFAGIEAQFQRQHDKTRFFTISSLRDLPGVSEPTAGWGAVLQELLYQSDPFIFHSGIGTSFETGGGVFDLLNDGIYAIAQTTSIGSPTMFGYAWTAKPAPNTVRVGEYWSLKGRKRDYWIIRSKLLPSKIDVTVLRSSSEQTSFDSETPDVTGTIIYHKGVSGDISVGDDRLLSFKSESQTSKSVSFGQSIGSIVASFDSTGLLS